MKSDHIKFSGSQQCEMNTKFGSYLQSTTYISLFCIPSNIESSGSWFDPYVSLFELLSQKSWSRRLKKSSQRIFQSSELTTDLALHSTWVLTKCEAARRARHRARRARHARHARHTKNRKKF